MERVSLKAIARFRLVILPPLQGSNNFLRTLIVPQFRLAMLCTFVSLREAPTSARISLAPSRKDRKEPQKWDTTGTLIPGWRAARLPLAIIFDAFSVKAFERLN